VLAAVDSRGEWERGGGDVSWESSFAVVGAGAKRRQGFRRVAAAPDDCAAAGTDGLETMGRRSNKGRIMGRGAQRRCSGSNAGRWICAGKCTGAAAVISPLVLR
jgi:hypothetical protein